MATDVVMMVVCSKSVFIEGCIVTLVPFFSSPRLCDASQVCEQSNGYWCSDNAGSSVQRPPPLWMHAGPLFMLNPSKHHPWPRDCKQDFISQSLFRLFHVIKYSIWKYKILINHLTVGQQCHSTQKDSLGLRLRIYDWPNCNFQLAPDSQSGMSSPKPPPAFHS